MKSTDCSKEEFLRFYSFSNYSKVTKVPNTKNAGEISHILGTKHLKSLIFVCIMEDRNES